MVRGHKNIKNSIKRTSGDIKLDTERLIDICMGIATGVKRLDKTHKLERQRRAVRDRKKTTHSTETRATLKETNKTLEVYSAKTTTLLGHLIQMFVL
jgi:hypothetical protein